MTDVMTACSVWSADHLEGKNLAAYQLLIQRLLDADGAKDAKIQIAREIFEAGYDRGYDIGCEICHD